MTNINDPLPWEQQKGEPVEAFLAFSAFRDMGPIRTIENAYQKQLRDAGVETITPQQMAACDRWRRYALQFDWQKRAQAFDRRKRKPVHESRAWLIDRNGINWHEERRQDQLARIEIYRHLRDALVEMAQKGNIFDTRDRRTTRTESGDWVMHEEKISWSAIFRIVEAMRKTIFPPDDMEVEDEYGNKHSKFTAPETIILAEEEIDKTKPIYEETAKPEATKEQQPKAPACHAETIDKTNPIPEQAQKGEAAQRQQTAEAASIQDPTSNIQDPDADGPAMPVIRLVLDADDDDLWHVYENDRLLTAEGNKRATNRSTDS